MTDRKFPFQPLKLTCTITWATIGLLSFPMQLLALSQEPITTTVEQVQIRFRPQQKPPTGSNGNPPTNGGTGTRGGCVTRGLPFPVLVGDNKLELPINERPSFSVYLPYTANESTPVEFILQDEKGDKDIYRIPFTLPGTPGVISISLPNKGQALDVGKTYRWYFKINCSDSASSEEKPNNFILRGVATWFFPPNFER